MKWQETCATCPLFEPMDRPNGFPNDQEFRLGICNGAPDIVCLIPVPAPEAVKRRILDASKPVPQNYMSLAPETFRRITDSQRPACSIHPNWSLFVMRAHAEQALLEGFIAGGNQGGPEGIN